MIIKNLFIYLCVCALGYVFYLLFAGYLSFYVFLIILITPFISLIILLLNVHKSKLSFINNKTSSIQDEHIPLQIKRDSLSMGYCQVTLFNKTYLLKQDINEIDFVYPHCGGINVAIEDYKQYDILNIFYLKVKTNQYTHITIFPKEIEYDFTYIQSTLPKQSEETYSTQQKGDDPTEIFDIHEYHDGDPLKNIHWKLSLKHQKLLIKENALPIHQAISIHCLFYEKDEDNDLVFQYLHYFCLYLFQHHYTFILGNEKITYYEQYIKVLTNLLWLKKDISHNTKTLYQYLIDKDGIHYVKR